MQPSIDSARLRILPACLPLDMPTDHRLPTCQRSACLPPYTSTGLTFNSKSSSDPVDGWPEQPRPAPVVLRRAVSETRPNKTCRRYSYHIRLMAPWSARPSSRTRSLCVCVTFAFPPAPTVHSSCPPLQIMLRRSFQLIDHDDPLLQKSAYSVSGAARLCSLISLVRC